MDVRDALNQIKSNLDSVTKNLKSSAPGSNAYGTTFRTEIFTDSDGDAGPSPITSPHKQNQQALNPTNQSAHPIQMQD